MRPHELLRRALEAGTLCESQIMEACERRMTTLDNPGFCLSCGQGAEGCEPDARGYECETCGEKEVYGAEECLLMLTI
jgi:hypothetical protein